MGNWRTVTMVGSMRPEHARALRLLLDRHGLDLWPGWDQPYYPLSWDSVRPSVFGIGQWPGGNIRRTGNLAGKDLDVPDVAAALHSLLPAAPSMMLAVHVGGPYQALTVEATVTVAEGSVGIVRPVVHQLQEIPESQLAANLFTNLVRPRRAPE